MTARKIKFGKMRNDDRYLYLVDFTVDGEHAGCLCREAWQGETWYVETDPRGEFALIDQRDTGQSNIRYAKRWLRDRINRLPLAPSRERQSFGMEPQ